MSEQKIKQDEIRIGENIRQARRERALVKLSLYVFYSSGESQLPERVL